MTEMATMLPAARLIWQILAKVPWLTGWLLRRSFPVSECKARFQLEVCGDLAVFELLSIRPVHALANMRIDAFNTLPCDVEFEATRLTATIDSHTFMDAVLNTSLVIPAAGRGHMSLPAISLCHQQVNWLRNLSRDYTRVSFTLYWKCKSVIHDWDANSAFEFPVHVHADLAESAGDGQQ